MCKECGCGEGGAEVRIGGSPVAQSTAPPDHGHDHSHGHSHAERTAVHGPHSIELHRPLLEKNQLQAERNRGYFLAKNLLVLNVVSSPGSGKTALLEATARQLEGKLRMGVITGDLATENDATRLRRCGVPVVQITTGSLCHLDAEMIFRALAQLDPDSLDLLAIENVGNLVCPADFDLGEALRVVLLSVTEGEDKPLKYPPLFHSADVAVVTKTDLAAAAGFDRTTALANLERISHHAKIFEVSAKTGEGMKDWTDFLRGRHPAPA